MSLQRIKPTLMTAVLSVVLLNGCAVGPDYKLPSSETPKAFARADSPEFSAHGVEVN